MAAVVLLKHLYQLYRLGRKRFRSPEDYMELMMYLTDDFATRVIRPTEYASGHVLDAGCSYGGFMEAFSKQGAACVTGLDLSLEKLQQGGVSRALVGDMTFSPFADGAFDLVYARGVIEHVPNQLAFCQECHRVLKSDGYVCITTSPWHSPHAGHPRLKPFHVLPFRLAKFLAEKTKGIKIEASDLRGLGLYPITTAKLKRILTISGFELIRSGNALFGMDWLVSIPLLNEILLQHVFVVGRRHD